MFRKMILLTWTAIIAAGSACSAFADEGLIVDEDTIQETVDNAGTGTDLSVNIWQGFLDGSSYTFLLESDSMTASVSRTDADGTLTAFSGSYAVDDAGILTVTSQDGTTQTWGAVSVSSCQDTVTGQDVEITCVKADPRIFGSVNEYAWYAGLSDEGDAYTYGISLDCTKLMFGFYTPGDDTVYRTDFSLDITDSGDGVISGTALGEEGEAYAFSYETIDDNALHARITLNGESCAVSAIEARIFPDYSEE